MRNFCAARGGPAIIRDSGRIVFGKTRGRNEPGGREGRRDSTKNNE